MPSENIQGPKRSRAQSIGERAEAAIFAQKPNLWALSRKDGSDYGYDFEALIFANKEDGGQFYINIQLKGTTQLSHLSANKDLVSHSFNLRTLKLWHGSGAPTVVLIVDFTETNKIWEAPIYFHLVNEDLENILPTIPDHQETVTLKIPTKIKLHEDLDIIPLVRPYLDDLRDARAELKRVRELNSNTVTAMYGTGGTKEQLIYMIDDGPSDIKGLIESSAQVELYQFQLNNLRNGDYTAVINAIRSPSIGEIESDPTDSGIRAYLLSRALEETSDQEQAHVLMRLASRLLTNNDEVLSGLYQIQMEALDLSKPGEEKRLALLEELKPHTGPYVTAMKARLLAMSGRFDEARKIIKGYPQEKIALTIPTISIIEHDWNRAIDEIEELSSIQIMQPKAKFWLVLLKARAYFERALRDVPRKEDEELFVPSVGLPKIDKIALKDAYDWSLKAMKEAQKLNWPTNVDYVLDIFAISSMIFEKMDSSLSLLTDFALAKPHLTKTREMVSRLAIQFGQPKIALNLAEIAKDFPKFENQDLLIATAINADGNPIAALELLNESLYENSVKNDSYFSSLLVLGLAADISFQPKVVERIRNELSAHPLGQDCLALLDCSIKVNHARLKKLDALIELKEYWLKNGRPYRMGLHLLDNTYPLDKAEAALAVEVAEAYLTKDSFLPDQILIYAHSLLTIGNHVKAVEVLDAASQSYPENHQIKSLLGIAFEVNGQPERAFSTIQMLLQDGTATSNARQYFCNIAIRMGYFETAVTQMRSALATSKSKDAQISIIETLIKLLFAMGNHLDEAESLIWKYGSLVDQNDEEYEGQFLQFYLMITSFSAVQIDETKAEALRIRMDAYSAKFPKSKVIWRANIPADGTGQEILDALNKAIGETPESLAMSTALERQMDRGEVAIPFTWRPRRYLRNVSDIFTLWNLNKYVNEERQGYHLALYLQEYLPKIPALTADTEIVVSLISLILMNELGLLDLFLKTFTKVVIARSVLMKLQASRSLHSSIIENQIATQILEKLQNHFEKIIHPPLEQSNESAHFIPWHLEEKCALLQTGRFYMCDDIIESAHVCPVDNQSLFTNRITTLDFLHWADQHLQLLSPQEVATYIGKMCDLHLGRVIIQPRYLFASIPKDLQEASTESEEQKAFIEAETLNSMLTGIWSFSKTYDEISDHFIANMTYLIVHGNAAQPVLTSLWARWVEAVRFKKEIALGTRESIGLVFVLILINLPDDKACVSKLWSALWVVLRRCCASELTKPEDLEGVELVAKALGEVRASDSRAEDLDVGIFFIRAQLAFEADTQLYKLFSDEYVKSAAQTAIRQSKSSNKNNRY